MLTGFAGENRTWRSIAQRLMRPLVVIEREPPANASARLDYRAIRLGEHLFIFQAAPQPLDEDVVEKPPLAIHADPHPRRRQFLHEPGAGELNSPAGHGWPALPEPPRRRTLPPS